MKNLETYLLGGDLRSIAKVDELLPLIKTQKDFDGLFNYLYSDNRLLVMRAADTIEKIAKTNSEFLKKHKKSLIKFLATAHDKEFKWHLVLLLSKLNLTETELGKIWVKLSQWALDPYESRIVRVNTLQSLYELCNKHKGFEKEFNIIVNDLLKENIPSIHARIKLLLKK